MSTILLPALRPTDNSTPSHSLTHLFNEFGRNRTRVFHVSTLGGIPLILDFLHSFTEDIIQGSIQVFFHSGSDATG
jgi:organic radical activating enzyme